MIVTAWSQYVGGNTAWRQEAVVDSRVGCRRTGRARYPRHSVLLAVPYRRSPCSQASTE